MAKKKASAKQAAKRKVRRSAAITGEGRGTGVTRYTNPNPTLQARRGAGLKRGKGAPKAKVASTGGKR